MRIFKGTVKSKRDTDRKGWLTVDPDEATTETTEDGSVSTDRSDNYVQVKYVSPYGGGEYAGAVFMPEAEQQILYCAPENDADGVLYYMGSIISPSYDTVSTGFSGRSSNPDPELPHDKDAYSIDDQSLSMGIKTPLGQQLLFQEYRGKKDGVLVDSKRINLESERKHGLYLDDSTETQKVSLHSGDQGAKIELSNKDINYDKSLGQDSAKITAIGNGIFKTWEGSLKLQVVDGQNFQILNNSTGGNAPACDKENEALGVAQKYATFGNLEIHTDRGDIVISSGGNGVFIDCMGGTPGSTGASFQVRSQNKIHLYSANGIDLKSAGDVNIVGKNVNIEGNTIELNPTTSVNDKIGIRNTNANILQEKTSTDDIPAGPKPFFVGTDAQGSFGGNYCESEGGLNQDERL